MQENRSRLTRLDELLELASIETDDCVIWPGSPSEKRYGRISGGSTGASPRLCHVIVCEHYHGPRPEGLEVRHYVCGDTKCVNPRHLCWGTRQENVDDQRRHGTWVHGEKHGHAVLTDAQVAEIRFRYTAGGVNQYELAEEFGVTQPHISYIIRGKKRGTGAEGPDRSSTADVGAG